MKNEALQRAIAKFPTLKSFAEALNTDERPVSYQMVQQWLVGAVPAEFCPDVERIAEGDVSRIELRPKDGHRIWPELVSARQAGIERRKGADRRTTDKKT